ncbi:MAG: endonuclease/exonuclease/phosphatase family protein, partial [Bacteroidales bacterium]|nr:endonuclease/exonuclease/phosphatase family protein [Bacteroidales bacterium]
ASFVVDGQLSAPYQVLYPGTTSENTLTLPSSQTYVENSFDPSAGAAYGNATYAAGTYSVTLRNFCGLIRLALKGSATLDRIVVHALGEETIAGDFVLESDADGFTGVFSGGGSPSLVYACEGQTLGETVRYFFIALPARTYSSGMEALVYQADGKYMRLKFWGDGKTLGASDIVAFEEKTYVAGRWDVLGELPALPQEESHFDTHLTVGSYNIWSSDMRTLYYTNRNNAGSEYYSGSGDGYMVDGDPRLWDTAKSYMAQTIANIAYDVFGLSEVSVLQKAELPGLVSAAGGSHYTWKFFLNSSVNDDSTPAADDEYEAIVYNNRLFTCERTGKFWLTDKDYGLKPHQGVTALSASDGNYRLVEYAFLTHNVTRKTFLFCHCHAPLNDAINEWAGGIIQYRITGQGSRTGSESSSYPINRNGYPVIFVGDLNATPSEGLLYSKLSAFWNCAYDQARETGMLAQSERENPGTWSNWRMQQSMLQSDDKRMDHVFVSSEFTVTRYWTNRFRYQTPYAPAASGFRRFYPSDHVPIVAELSL